MHVGQEILCVRLCWNVLFCSGRQSSYLSIGFMLLSLVFKFCQGGLLEQIAFTKSRINKLLLIDQNQVALFLCHPGAKSGVYFFFFFFKQLLIQTLPEYVTEYVCGLQSLKYVLFGPLQKKLTNPSLVLIYPCY